MFLTIKWGFKSKYTYYNTLNLLNVSYIEWKGENKIGDSNERYISRVWRPQKIYIADLEMILCAQTQPTCCYKISQLLLTPMIVQIVF